MLLYVLIRCTQPMSGAEAIAQLPITPKRVSLMRRRLATLQKGFGSGPIADEEHYRCFWPNLIPLEEIPTDTLEPLWESPAYQLVAQPIWDGMTILKSELDAFTKMRIGRQGVGFLAEHNHEIRWVSASLFTEDLDRFEQLLHV